VTSSWFFLSTSIKMFGTLTVFCDTEGCDPHMYLVY